MPCAFEDARVTWKPETHSFASPYLMVRDAELTLSLLEAIAVGGTVVQELRRAGDGDHRGGVADGNGIVWWISTQDRDRV